MRPRSISITVLLVGFLTFSVLQTYQSAGQSSAPQETQALVSALNAVRDAEAFGAAPSDIVGLTSDLNRALSLQNSNVTMSAEISSQIVSRAIVLQQESRAAVLRSAIISYSLAAWAAVLSAVIVLDSHRIANRLRRRKS